MTIVEDGAFVALDLAPSVDEADGKVVGRAATLREALSLVKSHISAAILDVLCRTETSDQYFMS